MNYLVDTHVFLWSVLSTKKLSIKAKSILLDPELITYVSTITFWEISLKFSLGKIQLKGILPDILPKVAQKAGFTILPFDEHVASSFYKLPRVKHKDPFDRMIAWQAINKGHVLLTRDKSFSFYNDDGLSTIW